MKLTYFSLVVLAVCQAASNENQARGPLIWQEEFDVLDQRRLGVKGPARAPQHVLERLDVRDALLDARRLAEAAVEGAVGRLVGAERGERRRSRWRRR